MNAHSYNIGKIMQKNNNHEYIFLINFINILEKNWQNNKIQTFNSQVSRTISLAQI